MAVAVRVQQRLERLLHVSSNVVIRHPRRMAMKPGVRLDGEVVGRDMLRRVREYFAQVGHCLSKCLLRQCVHQIDVDVVETTLRSVDCIERLLPIMNAPQCLQVARIQALYAKRQAVDTGVAKTGEATRLNSAGVGFQGDFGIGKQHHAGTQFG